MCFTPLRVINRNLLKCRLYSYKFNSLNKNLLPSQLFLLENIQSTVKLKSTMAAPTMYLFQGSQDRFDGITVDSSVENCKIEEFPTNLQESLKAWSEAEKRGIWFKVALEHADWVPILAKNGFNFHHAKQGFVMMYKWLPNEEDNIPSYSHTMIGVGAVVVNDKSEILVVREKSWKHPHWKLPGGYAEPGENLIVAAIREVHEETNISTEFLSLLNLRHAHNGMFGCSDIYIVVSLKPLTTKIEKCEREIADSKWMDIDEYLNHPNIHELNRMCVQNYLDYQKNKLKIDCKHGIHQVLKKPYTAYFVAKEV